MTSTGPAQRLDRSASEAVLAAQARDADRFQAAVARLDAADPQHVRRLLAAVVRPVLEDLHPDGVDGDDLAAQLDAAVRGLTWAPAVDPLALAVVLTGAFGIAVAEGEELPHPIADRDVVRHALLLLGQLLDSRRPLRPYLDRAWSEIERADLQD